MEATGRGRLKRTQKHSNRDRVWHTRAFPSLRLRATFARDEPVLSKQAERHKGAWTEASLIEGRDESSPILRELGGQDPRREISSRFSLTRLSQPCILAEARLRAMGDGESPASGLPPRARRSIRRVRGRLPTIAFSLLRLCSLAGSGRSGSSGADRPGDFGGFFRGKEFLHQQEPEIESGARPPGGQDLAVGHHALIGENRG